MRRAVPPVVTEQGRVPWPLVPEDSRAELARLRTSDPVAFLAEVLRQGEARGLDAVGFKLMYDHTDRLPEVREHLAGSPAVRVIHLTRRNLVRRLLSKRRAEITGAWQRRAGERDESVEQPSVEISPGELIRDVLRVEGWQTHYRQVFSGHPVLEVEYEALSAAPVDEARRCVEFLGQDPEVQLAVRDAKTGTDPLRDALANHDELRDTVRRWLSFFDS
jgi:LPS sulfotransferase NodH